MDRPSLERALATLPLPNLRAFVLAARHGSFKEAALALSVTPGAVSQQIAALEAHLGRPLFKRLNRAVVLTSAGQQLFGAIDPAFDALALAVAQQRPPRRLRQRLNLTVASGFASKWLAPRLHGFQQREPAIDIMLNSEDQLVDLAIDTKYDLAIRYGNARPATGLHIEPLWDKPQDVVAVCSPALARSIFLATPKAPAGRWPLLHVLPPQDGTEGQNDALPIPAYTDWRGFLEKAGVGKTEAGRAISRAIGLNSTLTALEAAYLGRGLALCPRPLVEEDIRGGRLMMPFPVSLSDPWQYWIIYRKQAADEAPLRAFLMWLRSEARLVSAPGGTSDASPPQSCGMVDT